MTLKDLLDHENKHKEYLRFLKRLWLYSLELQRQQTSHSHISRLILSEVPLVNYPPSQKPVLTVQQSFLKIFTQEVAL